MCVSVVLMTASLSALGAQQRGAPMGRGAAEKPDRPSIVGRVTEPSGGPARNVFVSAMAAEPRAGRLFQIARANFGAVTNERGEYQLDPLPFGDYYIVAMPRNPGRTADGRTNRDGFANTFHPATADVSKATRIRIGPGPAQTVDVTLVATKLAIIAGTVTNAAGELVRGGRLLVAPGNGFFGVGGGSASLSPNGAFGLMGLQPGTYHLHYRETPLPLPRTEIPKISGATVILNGTDVLNVRVTPILMVRGAGRIIVDPSLRAELPSPILVGTRTADGDGTPGPTRPGTVKDDLTFELRTWPGQATIHVELPSDRWVLKSVRFRGIDITTTPIPFVPGTDVEGLEVELTRR